MDSKLQDDQPPVALVVLGGGFSANGELSGSSRRRALAAVQLYLEMPRPVLFSGGPTHNGNPRSEAEAMSQLAQEHGVQSHHVILEAGSFDTWENARNSIPLLRKHGVKRALLVTSPDHAFRARLCFRFFGLRADVYRGPHLVERVTWKRVLFYECGALLRLGLRYLDELALKKVRAALAPDE